MAQTGPPTPPKWPPKSEPGRIFGGFKTKKPKCQKMAPLPHENLFEGADPPENTQKSIFKASKWIHHFQRLFNTHFFLFLTLKIDFWSPTWAPKNPNFGVKKPSVGSRRRLGSFKGPQMPPGRAPRAFLGGLEAPRSTPGGLRGASRA